MHPCSFSNGGTINLILTLTLTLTLTLRADHRGVRCAKSRCNTSSQNESQSGDRKLAACVTAYTQTYRHTHTQSQTPPKTIPDLHSIHSDIQTYTHTQSLTVTDATENNTWFTQHSSCTDAKTPLTGNSMSLGQQIHWQGQHGPSIVKMACPSAFSITYFGFHELYLYTRATWR